MWERTGGFKITNERDQHPLPAIPYFEPDYLNIYFYHYYWLVGLKLFQNGAKTRGGHYIGDCTPTRDRGRSEVKRSRQNFEAGQAVKVGIGDSLDTVKGSPGDRWAWLMLDSQGSRPDFWCGQGVKHKNSMGQDLDRGRRWKYRRLCSATPL